MVDAVPSRGSRDRSPVFYAACCSVAASLTRHTMPSLYPPVLFLLRQETQTVMVHLLEVALAACAPFQELLALADCWISTRNTERHAECSFEAVGILAFVVGHRLVFVLDDESVAARLIRTPGIQSLPQTSSRIGKRCAVTRRRRRRPLFHRGR